MIFQNEKIPFQAIKKRCSKSRKIDIFPKGLTHGFSPKMANFQTSFSDAIQTRKMRSMIFQNEKNAFLGHKNKKFKNSKNRRFSKGVNPWFWSKNNPFSNFFFVSIQARKMSFMIVQNVKTPFEAIKTGNLKSPKKIDIFPSGLTPGFGPKTAIFPTFLGAHYTPGKCIL